MNFNTSLEFICNHPFITLIGCFIVAVVFDIAVDVIKIVFKKRK